MEACAKTCKLLNSKKHFKQSPKGCKRLIGLLLAAKNQATRRNEIISQLQVGSSSRYALRLPQQETKSSTKLLALTDPFWVRKTFSKPASLKKGLLSISQGIPGETVRLNGTKHPSQLSSSAWGWYPQLLTNCPRRNKMTT